MQESTGGQEHRTQKIPCIEQQEQLVEKLIKAVVGHELVLERLAVVENTMDDMQKLVNSNDKRHTAFYNEIKNQSRLEYRKILDVLDQQNAKLDLSETFRTELKPYMDAAKPYMDKWPLWRTRLLMAGVVALVWVFISFLRPELSPAALGKFIEMVLK